MCVCVYLVRALIISKLPDLSKDVGSDLIFHLLSLTAGITAPKKKTSSTAAVALTCLLKDTLNVIMTQQWADKTTRAGNNDTVWRCSVARLLS